MPFLSLKPLDRQMLLILVLVCVAVITHRLLYGKRAANTKNLPFPPGPKPKILIGNYFDIPSVQQWIAYTNWGHKYGDLVHFKIFRKHTVVINSLEVARDLLDKKSNVYSDRFPNHVLYLMGWDWSLPVMRYSERWREQRRMFHQYFRPKASLAYRPTQVRKVHEMLHNLLLTPEDFISHGRTLSGAIIMSTVYGHEVTSSNDYFVSLVEQSLENVALSLFNSANLVNIFPILGRIPPWFPFAGFKRDALESQRLTNQMQNVPFNYAKENMNRSTGEPSLVAKLLERNGALGKGEEGEETIKRVTAVAYVAGADTTVCASETFFLAMSTHPEAQKAAQDEIDSVVGSKRMPVWDDRTSLPYVEALYREVMRARWHPVTPLGLPHATVKDDIYRGSFIPKGTIAIPNIWAMTHDERLYPDPDVFKPERFFTSDGKLNDDDMMLAFGFGRRICPGRYMADATVWFEIVSVLATFKITKAKDDAGVDIEVPGLYTDNLVSHPRPFQCSIVPRSDEAKNLILETMVAPTVAGN